MMTSPYSLLPSSCLLVLALSVQLSQVAATATATVRPRPRTPQHLPRISPVLHSHELPHNHDTCHVSLHVETDIALIAECNGEQPGPFLLTGSTPEQQQSKNLSKTSLGLYKPRTLLDLGTVKWSKLFQAYQQASPSASFSSSGGDHEIHAIFQHLLQNHGATLALDVTDRLTSMSLWSSSRSAANDPDTLVNFVVKNLASYWPKQQLEALRQGLPSRPRFKIMDKNNNNNNNNNDQGDGAQDKKQLSDRAVVARLFNHFIDLRMGIVR